MNTAHGSVISRVGQIAGQVEGLLNAQAIVLKQMPLFFDLGKDATKPD